MPASLERKCVTLCVVFAVSLASPNRLRAQQTVLPPPNNARWMTDNAALIGDTPLNRLALPGTHDSMTYTIDSANEISPDGPQVLEILGALPNLGLVIVSGVGRVLAANWSKAQGITVAEQLNHGIRYLDLRVCGGRADGELYYCHGFYGPHVSEAIDTARQFIEANPQEILILDFNHFYSVTTEQHQALAAQIQATFGDLLITDDVPVTTSLNQLWAQPGRVIVLYRQDADENRPAVAAEVEKSANGAPGHRLWSGSQMLSAWPAAAGWTTLNARIDTNLRGRCDAVNFPGSCDDGALPGPGNDPERKKLFVLQTQATPDAGYIIGQTLLLIGGDHSLRDLAYHRNVVHNVWDRANQYNACGGLALGPSCFPANIIISDWSHETNLVEMVKELNTAHAATTLVRTWMNDWRFMWAESGSGTFFGHRSAAQVSSAEGPEQTTYAPAVARLGGRVIAGWNDQERLHVMSRVAGQFIDRVHVSDVLGLENTGTPPALATFNGRVYMAWVAQDFHLAFMSSPDGVNWTPDVPRGEQIFSVPALAEHNGRLYVAYLGADNRLAVMSTADGVSWLPLLAPRVFSDWGPALQSFQGRLYLAWKGDGDHLTLYSSADGSSFDQKVILPEQTVRNPALAIFRNRLALGWIDPDDHSNIAYSSDGITFVDKATDSGLEAGGHDLRANGLSLIASGRPSMSATLTTVDGAPYAPLSWSNRPVRVRYTCVLGDVPVTPVVIGGAPFGPGEVLLNEGANQSVTAYCDNLTSFIPGINVDVAPPQISAVATTADGTPYLPGTLARGDVVIRFQCSDALSGVGMVTPPVTISTEGDTAAVEGSCSDNAGNTVGTSFGPITILQEPIHVSWTAYDNFGGPFYTPGKWAALVNVTAVCLARTSVVQTRQDDANRSFMTEGTGQFAHATCVDFPSGEVVGTGVFGPINIDRTPPTIQPVAVTGDGAAYTAGTPTSQRVTVSWSCLDALSGVAQVSPPTTFAASAPGVRGICTDVAGNQSYTDFGPITIVPAQPPTMGATATRAGLPYVPGTWSRQPVTVSFTCQARSVGVTIATISSPRTVGEGRGQFIEGQCTDSLGQIATTRFGPVNVDATAPSVACAAPSPQWLANDANLACSSTDALSGVASAADRQFTLHTSVPVDTETATAATDSRNVCDVAGNCVAAGPVAPNRIDKLAPAISITSPANPVYLLNANVLAAYACADGGSGVAVCQGSTPSGSPLPLAVTGDASLTVQAIDAVGNTRTAAAAYQVTYGARALFDVTQPVRAGNTLPVKLQLVDDVGVNLSRIGLIVTARSLATVPGGVPVPVQDAGNANTGGVFRFVDSPASYVFNLKTTGLSAGQYDLTYDVSGDPLSHVIRFTVR